MDHKKSLLGSVKNSMDKPSENTKSNRFDLADEILDKKSNVEIQSKIEPLVKRKKTMDLFENDIERITNTIERFMDMRQVINQSDVIRLGLIALDSLTNEELKDVFEKLKK